MPPSSGELWGHHLMPAQVEAGFFLPNGILVMMMVNRESTLQTIKMQLWNEAKKYPLFNLLMPSSSYIFVVITQEAKKEEQYDETRRFCDLRLFQTYLKLVVPVVENKEEKINNIQLSIAVGMPVSDANEIKDMETQTFRRSIMQVCKRVIDKRDSEGIESLAMYVYPPDIHSEKRLPSHVMDIISKRNRNGEILLNVRFKGETVQDMNKKVVKVFYDAFPNDVIAEAIRKQCFVQKTDPENTIKNLTSQYILKVWGREEYFLGNYPICQYKYIRQCISRGPIPDLMMVEKERFHKTLPKIDFSMPSYALKMLAVPKLPSEHPKIPLWNLMEKLRVKVNCATYVNIKEKGEIYIKTGIYHGTEPLCQNRDTRQVISTNPKWSEWLEFDLQLCDLPRCARICLSLCSVSKKQKRKVHYAISWCNINLFDFTNRFVSEKMSIRMWPVPPGFDDMLNPIGIPVPNPNLDQACIEIEFDKLSKTGNEPIYFPSQEEILAYGRTLEKQLDFADNFTKSDIEQVHEIIRRDPLSEISEQEKELLWRLRNYCKGMPDSLPKLLSAVKWNSREDVAQLYWMLKSWQFISPDAALELLYCTYTDLTVRHFAVESLKERLTDNELNNYLLQLVQVLEFEPYMDNDLTKFLLEKALRSQKIGHLLFWYLRSEMHQTTKHLRFGLILEAFCRSCGKFKLEYLLKQVQAIEKLMKLSDMLKQEKEDTQLKLLRNQLQSADYLDALQNFPNPLNYSYMLGDIIINQCDVKNSKKRPLLLAWKNKESDGSLRDFQIIFKAGDDLRQDMLTLQVIRIMDEIWQTDGLDLRMIPYGCLATGLNVGMIEVVRNAATVMHILKQNFRSAMMVRSKELHSWIKERTNKLSADVKGESPEYLQAIDMFTKSCAGYCVATFVLGIGDRHPSNIMVTENGQVFHIDFGHFLDHRKKKFGVNRERVPFVLTEDFIRVIAKGVDNPEKSPEFIKFMELCGHAYLCLRKHANVFITLFTMMLSCGIPELQSFDDIAYLRKTLMVDCKSDEDALTYFQSQFNEAYGGAWTTKVDWLFHSIKHSA